MDEKIIMSTKKPTAIYSRIMKLCKKKNWTLADFCYEIRQPRQTIESWKYKEPKTIKTLRKIQELESDD
jgi:hypothetical protein